MTSLQEVIMLGNASGLVARRPAKDMYKNGQTLLKNTLKERLHTDKIKRQNTKLEHVCKT